HIVCIERRDEITAALEEVEEAETEGVIIHAGFGPNKVIGQNGRVTALETVRTSRVFDENGRFSPQFAAGSESLVECDTVIMAIGQTPNLDFLGKESKIELSSRGLISVDRRILMNSVHGIFSVCHCVCGPRLRHDMVRYC